MVGGDSVKHLGALFASKADVGRALATSETSIGAEERPERAADPDCADTTVRWMRRKINDRLPSSLGQ